MASRSRKQRKPRPDVDARHGPTPQPRLRGEARNEQLRAGIEPLRPDERPVPLLIAIAVAVVLAAANLVLFAAGFEVRGAKPTIGGTIVFELVMLAAAGGMWLKRYWAVLGFQTLLGITAVYAGLSILVASNVGAALLCLVVIVLAGTLFYRLIRVMARLQAPQRPGRS